MESLTTLLFKVSEHVAYITLNRPATVNAVSLELAEELEEVARECDETNSVRAVLLTGAGRIFCAGGDLKSFAAQERTHLPTHLKRVNLFFPALSSASPGCRTISGGGQRPGRRVRDGLGVRRRHRPRERVRAFHDSLHASRLNARRIFNLLLATNHRTPPYDGTGVDESNFNRARSRSDWSGHAGSAR
jgi:Enoyl-CoA hydratase/isomerase